MTSEATSTEQSVRPSRSRKPKRGSRLRTQLAVVVCTVSLSALVVLGAMTSITLIPALFGWQPDVILSGSMEPSIHAGDVVVSSPITPEQIAPGRVILVQNPNRPGELLMHRVVSINPNGSVITRGDANNAADSTPVPVSAVQGLPRIRVPLIGLPALWMHNDQWVPLLGSLAALLITLWGATGVRRPTSRRRDGQATQSLASNQ